MCVIDCVLSELHKENSSGQLSKGIQEEDINKTHTFPKIKPVYHPYNKLIINNYYDLHISWYKRFTK